MTRRDLLPQTCSLLQRAEISKLNTTRQEEGMRVALVRKEVSVCINRNPIVLICAILGNIMCEICLITILDHCREGFFPCKNTMLH